MFFFAFRILKTNAPIITRRKTTNAEEIPTIKLVLLVEDSGIYSIDERLVVDAVEIEVSEGVVVVIEVGIV